MLSEQDDVDIHAMKRQGMTISEIARRIDRDQKVLAAFAKYDGVSAVACRTRSNKRKPVSKPSLQARTGGSVRASPGLRPLRSCSARSSCARCRRSCSPLR